MRTLRPRCLDLPVPGGDMRKLYGAGGKDDGAMEAAGADRTIRPAAAMVPRGCRVAGGQGRSAARGVGKESVRQCRCWWSPSSEKKNLVVKTDVINILY